MKKENKVWQCKIIASNDINLPNNGEFIANIVTILMESYGIRVLGALCISNDTLTEDEQKVFDEGMNKLKMIQTADHIANAKTPEIKH